MDWNWVGLIVSGCSHQRRYYVEHKYHAYSIAEANYRIHLLFINRLIDLLFEKTAIASRILLTREKREGQSYLIASSSTGGSNVVTWHFLCTVFSGFLKGLDNDRVTASLFPTEVPAA